MPTSFVEKVSGRTVLDAQGQIVGTVEDLLLEEGALRIASVRMRLKREVAGAIGASSSLFRAAVVDVPSQMVRAVGDAVILSVDAAALHALVAEAAPPPKHQEAASEGR